MAYTLNVLEQPSVPTIGKDFHREYSPLRVEVITDDDNAGWPLVLTFIGINLFSTHPDDSAAYCVNIKPQRDMDNPRYWIVEYQYSTKIDITVDNNTGQPQPQTQTNPLERKGRIRFSTRRYQEAIIKDITGNPLRNTALDPFDHVEDRALLTIQIQRNLPLASPFGNIPVFNALTIADYVGSINSVAFLGFSNREVLCDDLEAEPKQESGGPPYWDVNALFVIKPFKGTGKALRGGWLTRKLNAGYRELVDGAWVAIEENGQRPARPVLLDINGQQMDPGTPGAPAEALFETFYTKPEVDFNLLGLLT
jgi:hypothetical protein